MSNFNNALAENSVDEYAFLLDLTNGSLKFSSKNPSKFKLRFHSGQEENHEWYHSNTSSGAINHKQLKKHLNQDFRSSEDIQSDFRIGSLPATMFRNGLETDPHGPAILFKYNKSKVNKQNDFVISGQLMSLDFLHEHREMLLGAFGSESYHSTLRFDSTHFYDLNSVQGRSDRVQQGPLKRVFDSSKIDSNFDQDRGPLNNIFNDFVDDVKKVGNKIGNGLKHAGTATGDWFKGAAEDTGDWFKGAAQTTVHFAKGATASVVNAAEDVYNALTQDLHWEFGLKWPEVTYDKKFPDSDTGPLDFDFKLKPAGSGTLELSKGIVGTLIKPDSASFKYTQDMGLTGVFNLVSPKYTKKEKYVLGSIEVPADETKLIDAFVAKAEVDVDVDFDFDSSDLTLGATIEFSPGAELTLGGGDTGLRDASDSPTVTTHIPDFNKFKPEADLSIVVTPKISMALGPTVPSEVPYVGGTTVFGVDLVISNPLTLNWKSCEPEDFIVGTKGLLTSNADFMGAKLEPAFVDKVLYGPLLHTIDTGFTDITCDVPAAVVSGVDQGVYETYLS